MTTKAAKGAQRLESEIEKLRDESNWKKVIEVVDQLKSRPQVPAGAAGLETLANFLIGESKLELYLEENPPSEHNVTKARTNLSESKRYLLAAMSGQSSRLGILHEAYLLLAKLHFAMGVYDESLNNLRSAGLDSLASERPMAPRAINIIAEAFAVRAFCLDKMPPTSTSKAKIAERDDQVIRCLEMASDLALLYLQERDRLVRGGTGGPSTSSTSSTTTGMSSPLPPGASDERRLGTILETALQRTPILHIQNGKLTRAILQYRNILSSVETLATQSLRLTLARQLAEVLLRGVSELAYTKPEWPVDTYVRPGSGGRTSTSSDSPWKPRKYVGHNLFLPKDENEEIILLLLIGEGIAVKEAVLSRLPEHTEARLYSLHNATAVYDLMTITLVRRAQTALLCESFDRALKFSFEEFHIWFQFALSLSASGKHARSVLFLKSCARMKPENALPSLMAAKMYYEHLNDVDEGLKCAREAAEREKANSQGLAARCQLVVGVGCFLKSEAVHLNSEKQELLCSAYEAFHRAQQLDPNDYLAEYFLSLYYAEIRQIAEGIQHVKIALQLRCEHVNSLMLLALLLSAQKNYSEALELIVATLEEYPDNFNLLYIKAHLEEFSIGGEEALMTSKQMLLLWRSTYEEQTQSEMNIAERKRRGGVAGGTGTGTGTGGGISAGVSGGLGSAVAGIAPNVFQLYSSEMSDRDSCSLRAGNSLAASKVEHALSEVASSMSSYHPRPGPKQAWDMQIQIWLLLAGLYLKMDQLTEANSCINEAAAILPMSHHVMFMRGLINERQNKFTEAKKWFLNAFAINPRHVRTLQHLGMIYLYLGRQQLAEKTLREAVTVDPLSHKCWFNMGVVMDKMGEHLTASECFFTAIDLEATSPILPFSIIPKCLD